MLSGTANAVFPQSSHQLNVQPQAGAEAGIFTENMLSPTLILNMKYIKQAFYCSERVRIMMLTGPTHEVTLPLDSENNIYGARADKQVYISHWRNRCQSGFPILFLKKRARLAMMHFGKRQ